MKVKYILNGNISPFGKWQHFFPYRVGMGESCTSNSTAGAMRVEANLPGTFIVYCLCVFFIVNAEHKIFHIESEDQGYGV